jgi:hypothetical protein
VVPGLAAFPNGYRHLTDDECLPCGDTRADGAFGEAALQEEDLSVYTLTFVENRRRSML